MTIGHLIAYGLGLPSGALLAVAGARSDEIADGFRLGWRGIVDVYASLLSAGIETGRELAAQVRR